MINLIVFSKNRPLQLQATIDSIEKNCPNLFNNIGVVYLEEGDYKKGYELLKYRKPYINFVAETNFKNYILSLMEGEYICMSADDDLYLRGIDNNLVNNFTDSTCCFSLRLGLNIEYCYSQDKPNKLKNYKEEGDYIRWNWRDEELDFGYPLSVVSHIFRTKQIKDFTEKEEFKDVNTYEGVLQRHLNECQPEMVAYKESKAFGVPANKVNTTTNNRNGIKHPYSTEELLKAYLNGFVIDISNIKIPKSAQQEIKYEFI